jgi:hypothetical protein
VFDKRITGSIKMGIDSIIKIRGLSINKELYRGYKSFVS